MKVSHVDHRVVDDIINKIEDDFGKITVTRDKVHKFVGMDIWFKDNKMVEITIVDYLTECFEAFEEPF